MLQTPLLWKRSKKFPFKFDDSAFASVQLDGGRELHFTTDGTGVLYEYDVTHSATLNNGTASPPHAVSRDDNAPLAAAVHKLFSGTCVYVFHQLFTTRTLGMARFCPTANPAWTYGIDLSATA
ncbi:hypothetical protein FRB94_014330 [Tulasnella sp. JGI-2019a]|nr:hypothetical protein FRB94_014330 [Tulasnella sp. JGI-2019a]KAG9036437.1 hypothetical protein FRB95_008978 [Tulasnella sp. JGI-2019a]